MGELGLKKAEVSNLRSTMLALLYLHPLSSSHPQSLIFTATMFSLVKLTTFVTITFGAIAAVSAAAVQTKRQSDGLTAILAELTAQLAPAAAQLSSSFPFVCHISGVDRYRDFCRLPRREQRDCRKHHAHRQQYH